MASQNKFTVKRLVLCAVFSAMAIILSYLEFLFPINLGIPGVKIGLPNLIILVAIYELKPLDTFAINLVRIGISGLLFSGVFGTIYSLAGGMISLGVMLAIKKTEKFSIIGVSFAGGVAHNLGQLIIAVIIMQDLKVFLYFPVLLLSGLAAGTALGFIAYPIVKKLPKSFFVSE